jgi:hypothetical protein
MVDDLVKKEIMKEIDSIEIPKGLKEEIWKNVQLDTKPKNKFKNLMPLLATAVCIMILIPIGMSMDLIHFNSRLDQVVSRSDNHQTKVKSGEVVKSQGNTKSYVSKVYKVSLNYNKNWKRNTQYDIRFEGISGFFQFNAISGDGLNIDKVANNEANHKLKPYGSSPSISKMTIQGQEARLIMPSEDQPKEYKQQAELIVKYPNAVTINGNSYAYFVLSADKSDIVEIAKSLKFLQTAPTTTPDSENLNAQQLARYYEKNGINLPFSGLNVMRVSLQNFTQNLTNQTTIRPNGTIFESKVEFVLDEWKGNLNNKPFDFEIYQNLSTKDTFVGVVYDNHLKVAYSCQSKICMVHNFTGNYITLAASNTSEKYFSINLKTGEVIPFSERKLNLDLAGIDSSHSSNKAKWIKGLNKKYPFKKVNAVVTNNGSIAVKNIQ